MAYTFLKHINLLKHAYCFLWLLMQIHFKLKHHYNISILQHLKKIKKSDICFIVSVLLRVSAFLCGFPKSVRSEQGSSERAGQGDIIWLILAPLLQYPWLSDPLSLKHRPIVSGLAFYCVLNGWAMLKTKACVCLPKVSVFKLPHNGRLVFTLHWTEVYQCHHKLVCFKGVMAIVKFSHNGFIKVTITFGKQAVY